jgi:NAD(P)-dependent dehydrogenase (short-subunit alcohol dehydrogenase family)
MSVGLPERPEVIAVVTYAARVPLVILTGATSGIGRAAANALARQGASLALVGRDPERVARVAGEARAAGVEVHEHVADLERMDEVRRLAGELLERHERIDVLANNAGAMFTSRHVTADGFERTFALNHLAPFLLTQLLYERLRASAPARVVTTASDAHSAGALDFEDLQSERSFRPMRTYGTSKLCNILFTRELARRGEGAGVTATCFHPGVVRTGFGKNDGILFKAALTVAGPFLRSPARGARSLVWLALAPEAAELTGVYVQDEKVIEPSPAARDDDLAAELWRRSQQLVGSAA